MAVHGIGEGNIVWSGLETIGLHPIHSLTPSFPVNLS